MNSLMARRRALLAVRKAGLPSEYQEVEWIGTQSINDYIITNIPTNSNGVLRAVIDCRGSAHQFCFGNANGSTYKGFNIYADGGKAFTVYPSKERICSIANVIEISVALNNGTATGTANGEQFTLSYNAGDSNPYSIFRCNAYLINPTYGKYKLIELSFETDGGTTYNFIPCYRKNDGVIGVFDIENSVFYTNAGTGTFTKGADV